MTEPDMEKFVLAAQAACKAWGDAITEQFRPFNEAAARWAEQERKRRAGV